MNTVDYITGLERAAAECDRLARHRAKQLEKYPQDAIKNMAQAEMALILSYLIRLIGRTVEKEVNIYD